MVSLGGSDTNFHTNVVGRSPERTSHSDTAPLIPEADDVAFWDMSFGPGGNHMPSTVLSTGYEEDLKVHPIGNIPLILVIIVFVMVNAVLTFILPEICPDHCGNTTALSLIAYLQIGLFFLIMVADILLRKIHFQSRSWGYLEFYRRTRFLRKFPLAAFSVGLALFLFCVILTEQLCTDEIHCVKNFSRANLAQLVCCLETVVIVTVCGRYLYVSHMFNKSRPTPDVLQEDLSTERILQTSINHGSQVGFKDSNFKEDLLEKQADEILYLKKRNNHLSSRILHLTQQLHASPDNSVA